jgi:hypothetical protein
MKYTVDLMKFIWVPLAVYLCATGNVDWWVFVLIFTYGIELKISNK